MLTLLPLPTNTLDHAAARREGWGVFDCDRDSEGRPQLRLQRIDAPADGTPPFPDDRDAWSTWSPTPAPGPPCNAPRSRRSTTSNAC